MSYWILRLSNGYSEAFVAPTALDAAEYRSLRLLQLCSPRLQQF
jgi:hypothetical protein